MLPCASLRIARTLIALLACWSAAWADEVALKNGDRITGQIIKKAGGKLTIKAELGDPVTVPWDAITSIQSKDDLTVVLSSGTSLTGKLSTRDGKIEIQTAGRTESAAFADVTALRNADEQRAYDRLLRPGWVDLWAGYFDFGFALAKGNADSSTLTTAFNATRATNRDKTVLYFNSINARAVVNNVRSRTAQAVRGGWAYNINVSPRMFVNVFNDYEYDAFQNLDLRFVAGGGLGFTAIKNENTRLDLLGGFAYNREKFDRSPLAALIRNSGEVYWGDDFTHKMNDRVSFRQSFRMFHNVSQGGEYRINGDVGLATQLFKWLSWQVTGSSRYLSNPLPGRKTNDLLLTAGVRVTFAR